MLIFFCQIQLAISYKKIAYVKKQIYRKIHLSEQLKSHQWCNGKSKVICRQLSSERFCIALNLRWTLDLWYRKKQFLFKISYLIQNENYYYCTRRIPLSCSGDQYWKIQNKQESATGDKAPWETQNCYANNSKL